MCIPSIDIFSRASLPFVGRPSTVPFALAGWVARIKKKKGKIKLGRGGGGGGRSEGRLVEGKKVKEASH